MLAPDPIPPVAPPRPHRDSGVPRALPSARPSGGHSLAILPDSTGRRSAPDSGAERDAELALVRDALECGKPDLALRLLDVLWSEDVDEECWFLRGQALYQLGRLDDAHEIVGQGLARLPQSAALLLLWSTCELMAGRPAVAERVLARALAVLPDHPVLLARRAELLARCGRPDEAVELLERAGSADHVLTAHARMALAAAVSSAAAQALAPTASGDPYGRVSVGLSLLAARPQPPGAGESWDGGRLALLAVVGVTIVLAVFGFRVAAAALVLTGLAVLRPWRARG